jgi:hypothetical protein
MLMAANIIMSELSKPEKKLGKHAKRPRTFTKHDHFQTWFYASIWYHGTADFILAQLLLLATDATATGAGIAVDDGGSDGGVMAISIVKVVVVLDRVGGA